MNKPRPALRAVETLPVQNLRDTVARARHLADLIEKGEVKARRVLCVVETADGKVELYQWGDVDLLGDIGLLEAAKVELAAGARGE